MAEAKLSAAIIAAPIVEMDEMVTSATAKMALWKCLDFMLSESSV